MEELLIILNFSDLSSHPINIETNLHFFKLIALALYLILYFFSAREKDEVDIFEIEKPKQHFMVEFRPDFN